MQKIIELLKTNRRWLGMALVLGGAGLMLVHFVDYGSTLHFPVEGIVVDHGVVGLILVIIGAFLGLGKPGARAKKPGKEE